jgi:hypothetical protein
MSFLSGIFTRRGTKVLHEGGPVPTVIPDENVYGLKLGMAAKLMRGLPPDTFYFYVHADPATIEDQKRGESKGYAFFNQGVRSYRTGGPDNIDEIFKRVHRGVIAVYEVVVSPEKGWSKVTYVNMMSVRPGWKRNGINMAMMRRLVELYPDRKLQFSDPTHQGEAFIKAAKAAGLPVKS